MKCVAEVDIDIPYERIQALVTDSAAYCKKHIEKSCHHCFPDALMCHALHILST